MANQHQLFGYEIVSSQGLILLVTSFDQATGEVAHSIEPEVPWPGF